MKNEIKVGQHIYLLKDKEITSYEVCRVGRKYFYIKYDYRELPISLEDLRHENENYSQFNKQFYLSEQELKDAIELKELRDKMRNQFSMTWRYSERKILNLDQLRRINNIIEE